MRLKWTEPATVDLGDIESWIARHDSPLVAIDVVLNVINVTERLLSAYPEAGRAGRTKGTRELIIDGLPYVVVYRLNVSGDWLAILRVLHDAQHRPE